MANSNNIFGEIHDAPAPISRNWKIQNYFLLPQKADSFIESPRFQFLNTSWYLLLYPNGERAKGSVGWLGLYLVKSNHEEKIDSVSYEMGIRSSDGGILVHWKCSYHSPFGTGTPGLGYHRFIPRNELLKNKRKLSPDNALTIFFHFSSLINAKCQTISTDGLSCLSRDFCSLLQNKQKADVRIKVGSRDFHVHKLILGTRSSVFAAMFEHKMKESSSGIVNIEDCDPDDFQEFLLFIYTGKFEKLSSENVVQLYSLSDKYNLTDFKEICLNFMKDNLSLETVCDVMTIAVRHNEKELRDSASKLIVSNIKILIPTEQWIAFMRENPLLASELLMTVIP